MDFFSYIKETETLFQIKAGRNLHGTSWQWEVHVTSSHPILAAHFPGLPVVPGIMQLHLVRRAAEHVLKKSLAWESLQKAKFFNPWTPSQAPVALLMLSIQEGPDETTGRWRVDARIAHGEMALLQVKGQLRAC